MKHLAAYLLLNLAGNTSPSAGDIKEVLSSVGIEADSERLDKLLSELEGKDIQQVGLQLRKDNGDGILIPVFSSSLRARASSPPYLAVVLVVPLPPLPVVLPRLVVLLRRLRLPPRRKPRRRSRTRTWVLVSSTKRVAHGMDERWSTGCGAMGIWEHLWRMSASKRSDFADTRPYTTLQSA